MYLNARSVSVQNRILSVLTKDIAVCSVVKAELSYGAMRSNNSKRTLEKQQSFLDH
jgi:tRNA(fMet)-specific endonuclease VapC